jgi:trehalose-phosphatase
MTTAGDQDQTSGAAPTAELDPALAARIDAMAREPVLLVASDYDGTIAPIVDDPAKAAPHREAIVALQLLANLPETHVAVISGRSLADLAGLTNLPGHVHLVGSHGSEFDPGFHSGLSPATLALRERIASDLGAIANGVAGASLEHKPASVAFHYRNADAAAAERALEAIGAGPARIAGVHTKHGKMVVELCAVEPDKGAALDRIRQRCGAGTLVFLGDDVTDEDAFAVLREADLGIKIGEGETAARWRIGTTRDACRVLARLAEKRAEWLEGAAAVPIEHHSVLSDQRTLALVTPGGRVSWMCAPRVDSSAIFAELLGGETAGHFTVRGTSGPARSQAYHESSMVVETVWDGFTVTDLLDCSSVRPTQRAGRSDLIRVIKGTGRAVVEFAPRLDFGRTPTQITARDGGLVVEDTHDPIVLRAPGVAWEITDHGPHQTARAEIDLDGRALTLELRYGSGDLSVTRTDPADRVRLTDLYWRSWAERLRLPGVRPDLVRRSALVLRSLCHGPTGAILAAGTTSLPEEIGGVRNWDYRFCWLRDGAMTAASLVRLGSVDEAMGFLDWMVGVVERCDAPDRLHPLYTVAGHELGTEAEIRELGGYRCSKPVRVGNAAAHQVQLDVFGPIVGLVAELLEHDAPLSPEHWRLVEAMVTAVANRWHEPDHGIWEIRKARRHHVHSKVMSWMTVDRAIRIAARFLGRASPDWEALRDRIRDDVIEHGYKPGAHAFTAAYDGDDLDAAALAVGLTGLLPPDDPRFVGTVEAVERVLREGPTVYRYLADDGLPGHEGGFHICAGWLLESYLLIGRTEDARTLFEDLCDLAGPTGILTEEYLPKQKLHLGNTPQAYSHLAIIDAALALELAGVGVGPA